MNRSPATVGPGARHGFALAELLVAVVLAGIVASAAVGVTASVQRHAQRVVERAALEGTLLQAARVVNLEWSTLAFDSATADLVVSGDTIRYRAFRGLGVACSLDPAGVILDRRTGWIRQLRDPIDGRDSLALLLTGDSTTLADDAWVLLPIVAPPTVSPCPGGGGGGGSGPGLLIPTGPLPGPASGLRSGSPVAWFEIIEWRAYRSGALDWMGVRSVSGGEGIQPFLGPLQPRTGGRPAGISALLLDPLGNPTASEPALIGLAVRGHTSGSVAAAGWASHHVAVDSVVPIMTPRNRP